MKLSILYITLLLIVLNNNKKYPAKTKKSRTYDSVAFKVYNPVGGKITETSQAYFTVKAGYNYFKIWIKARADSGKIYCSITKGSITGSLVRAISLEGGKSISDIIHCTKGTYYLSFTSSDKIDGQYNVKVATTVGELR